MHYEIIHSDVKDFSFHRDMFSLAFSSAIQSMGISEPNPSVGAVLVDRLNRTILGVGSTREPGKEHAEIVAIEAVKKKYPHNYSEVLKNASLYVTLEPCSHYGRTPPCSLAIMQNGIPEINIGVKDPSDKVNGKSIRGLLRAGHIVRVLDFDILFQYFGEAFAFTLGPFFIMEKKKRPMIIYKWARDINGFLCPEKGKSGIITSESSRHLVHRMRRIFRSTMVTPGTIRSDHPRLDYRIKNTKFFKLQPMEFVNTNERITDEWIKKLIETSSLPSNNHFHSRIFILPKIDSHEWNKEISQKWIKNQLRISKRKGRPLFFIPNQEEESRKIYESIFHENSVTDIFSFRDFMEVLEILYKKDINRVFIESGPRFAQYLLDNAFIDFGFSFIYPYSRWRKGRFFELSLPGYPQRNIGNYSVSSIWEIFSKENIDENDRLFSFLSKNIKSLIE